MNNYKRSGNWPRFFRTATTQQKFKWKFQQQFTISETHPRTIEYFRSEVAISKEKRRHLNDHQYTIHPLSAFHQIYEIFSFVFYGILIVMKTFDFGFVQISYYGPFLSQGETLKLLIVLDILSVIVIGLQFFIGFCVENTKTIELSKLQIAKNYILTGHFLCDLLSSIPRVCTWDSDTGVYSLVRTLTLLKLRRLTTFIPLIKPVALFFGIKSRTGVFLFGFFCSIFLFIHLMTCLRVGVLRYRIATEKLYDQASWFNPHYDSLPVCSQYAMSFFRCAQYTLLVSVSPTETEKVIFWEDGVFAIFSYIIGKIVISTMWLILLNIFLSRTMLRSKYEQVITELNEYGLGKEMSQELRNKMFAYYDFKYQKVFFNETLINSVLSQRLRREMEMFLCQSLVKHKIFSHIHVATMQQLITRLIPEIFQPKDLIVQSGTLGDEMYFIDSGTVAIFTPSGKELCHLQEGAHFGEIALLLKPYKRTATVVAVETSMLYRLTRIDFRKYFTNRTAAYKQLLCEAEKRLEQNRTIDESYKNWLFEHSY